MIQLGAPKLGTLGENPIKFSIVIAFRNEAQNLKDLAHSLSQINYPKEAFEVLFINDESTDKSTEILQEMMVATSLNYQILNNEPYSKSPKKDAITLGVKKSNHPWIVTTDADCLVPENWLKDLGLFIQQKNPFLVAMPVLFIPLQSPATLYQYFDGISLQGVTMGGFGWQRPLLCNGANLAYKKDTFYEVNGFEGNNHIASGDDIFLLEKIQQEYPKKLQYLNTAQVMVATKPVSSWKKLIHQRIRWASKTRKQQGIFNKLLGVVVLLGNLGWIAAVVAIFIYPLQLFDFLILWIIKLMADALFIVFSANSYNHAMKFKGLPRALLVYPFITIWVVLHSFKGSYQWRGRTFKK